jgi:hypothetical protein
MIRVKNHGTKMNLQKLVLVMWIGLSWVRILSHGMVIARMNLWV